MQNLSRSLSILLTFGWKRIITVAILIPDFTIGTMDNYFRFLIFCDFFRKLNCLLLCISSFGNFLITFSANAPFVVVGYNMLILSHFQEFKNKYVLPPFDHSERSIRTEFVICFWGKVRNEEKIYICSLIWKPIEVYTSIRRQACFQIPSRLRKATFLCITGLYVTIRNSIQNSF